MSININLRSRQSFRHETSTHTSIRDLDAFTSPRMPAPIQPEFDNVRSKMFVRLVKERILPSNINSTVQTSACLSLFLSHRTAFFVLSNFSPVSVTYWEARSPFFTNQSLGRPSSSLQPSWGSLFLISPTCKGSQPSSTIAFRATLLPGNCLPSLESKTRSLKSTTTRPAVGGPKTFWEDQRHFGRTKGLGT